MPSKTHKTDHQKYKIYPTPCIICEKEFLVEKFAVGKAKYCSKECRVIGIKKYREAKKPILSCRGCGVEFYKKGNNQFCSQKCYAKWHGSQMRGENNSNYSGGKISLQCKICQSVFAATASRAISGRSKYCSKKCFKIANTKEKAQLTCKSCHKVFYASPSKAKKVSTCSKECAAKIKNHIPEVENPTSKHSKYKRFTLICKVCNEEYKVYKYQLESSSYCSRKCLGASKTKTASSKPKIIKKCEICKKEFCLSSSRNAKRFCSASCASKYLGDLFKGNKSSKYVNRIERNCEQCKTIFYVRPAEIQKGNGKFCSKKCKNENLKVDKLERECPSCHKLFYVIPTYKRRIFCSNACRIKGNPSAVSSIELKMKTVFADKGYFPEHQYQFGYYIIDFAFPDQKLAIECDGKYWHSFPEAKRRDKAKNTYLNNKGWQIIRLKEDDIKENADECAARVIRVLKAFS